MPDHRLLKIFLRKSPLLSLQKILPLSKHQTPTTFLKSQTSFYEFCVYLRQIYKGGFIWEFFKQSFMSYKFELYQSLKSQIVRNFFHDRLQNCNGGFLKNFANNILRDVFFQNQILSKIKLIFFEKTELLSEEYSATIPV